LSHFRVSHAQKFSSERTGGGGERNLRDNFAGSVATRRSRLLDDGTKPFIQSVRRWSPIPAALMTKRIPP